MIMKIHVVDKNKGYKKWLLKNNYMMFFKIKSELGILML